MMLEKMHSAISIYLIACFVFFALPALAQVESTTKFTLKPKQTFGPKRCTTRNNETGICVHKSNCNDDHEIEHGGRISESELRTGSDCDVLIGEWCCSEKNVTTPIAGTGGTVTVLPGETTVTPTKKPVVPEETTVIPKKVPVEKCIVSGEQNFPGFVKLYRGNENYAFCLGALMSSKSVLTTATCLVQAKGQSLGIRVPYSADPEANYNVDSRIYHPKFNSGNKLNDLGLLITSKDIELGTIGRKGTCIDLDHSLGGECIAATLNEYEDFDMVRLFVTQGSCFAGGNVSDAMCGNGEQLDTLLDGAPIVCPKNNVLILAGLTKTSYPTDTTKALLGNLDYPWLVDNLKNEIGLNDEDFLYKLNY